MLPLARAAVAAGADGIIVEVHPRPEEALCDGPQQIPTARVPASSRDEIRALVELMGKHDRLSAPRALDLADVELERSPSSAPG